MVVLVALVVKVVVKVIQVLESIVRKMHALALD